MNNTANLSSTNSISGVRKDNSDMELSNPLWITRATYHDSGSLKSVRITSKPLGMALWLVVSIALVVGIVIVLPFHVVVNVLIALVVTGVANVISWFALLAFSCMKCDKR